MLTTVQLRKLVDRALMDRAPGYRKELARQGALDRVLDQRVTDIEEAVEFAVSKATHEAATSSMGFLERVQHMEMAKKRALEQAIEVNTEFSPDESSTSASI